MLESSSSPKIGAEAGTKTGVPGAARFPADAYEQQDAIFAKAYDVVRNGVAQAVFPAASIAVTSRGKLVALKAFGHFTYEPDSPSVTIATVFDLASVLGLSEPPVTVALVTGS